MHYKHYLNQPLSQGISSSRPQAPGGCEDERPWELACCTYITSVYMPIVLRAYDSE